MKRTLLALAALASVSTLASAQSSVTLFGVVDASVRSVKNGSAGSQTQLASGDNTTSRWGLRGVEDLGGGLKASFHLESQIALDTGSADAAKFFGRRSTVSLSGGFGEVRLGRDYTPTFMNGLGDEFGIVGIGSRGIFLYGGGSNLGSPAATVLRADNAVSYFLPNMGGIYGQVQISAGEGVVGNRYAGGGLGYKNQAMDVGVAYGTTDVGTDSDFKHYNVKFNYNFGFATLHTLYDVKTWGDRKTQDISIGASIPVATGTIHAGYTRANRSGGPVGSGYADGDDSTRLALGYVHDLSKRTALYTTVSRITNKGAARSSVLGTAPAGMLGGENSSGYEVGLRHTF
ncbi:porin [Hydrogenophaga sp. PBC]|uniref:porin n=1 Tax=Hydrogenophaga sp. PBC TaxID=795665 RepID=UPI0002607971|nr:porin [Hydrogenophaga sp. PBC]AOS78036.1 porin [Hydrogenophaga sp. PBC]